MNKIGLYAVLCIAAFTPAYAMAEVDTVGKVFGNVWLAKTLYEINGEEAFDIINGNDSFEPFVFAFDTTSLVRMASSDYPELIGNSTFDISGLPYTVETLNEKLDSCSGLWFYDEFSPEEGTTLREVLYVSKLDGYGFASGFFLPDLNLPERLDEMYLDFIDQMILDLNDRVYCAAPSEMTDTMLNVTNLDAKLGVDSLVITGMIQNTGTEEFDGVSVDELSVGELFLSNDIDKAYATNNTDVQLSIKWVGYGTGSTCVTAATYNDTRLVGSMMGCEIPVDEMSYPPGSFVTFKIEIASAGQAITEIIDMRDTLTMTLNAFADDEVYSSGELVTVIRYS